MIEIKTKTKTRPFNLEKALAGEPVKLRSGEKAKVIKVLREEEVKNISSRVIGILLDEEGKMCCIKRWAINGKYFNDGSDSFNDIVSMWDAEKKEEIHIKLPLPLKKPKTGDKGVGVHMELFFNSEEELKPWVYFFKWLEKYKCER